MISVIRLTATAMNNMKIARRCIYSMAINGKHYVVVSTDASTTSNQSPPEHRRTGFAYYIRDDEGTYKHAWYSDEMYSSTLAEVEAMMEAMRFIAVREYPPNTTLIIYCDNMHVIKLLNGGIVNKKSIEKYKNELETIAAATAQFVEVDARHVRGHTKGELKRYYMNDWCDKNSRSMRRHKKYYEEVIREHKKGSSKRRVSRPVDISSNVHKAKTTKKQ